MFLWCFLTVRERLPLSMLGQFSVREHIRGMLKNDQLLLVLLMSFLLINVFNLRGGGYMYFINYVLKGGAGYASMFFGMVTLASILGAVIVNQLTKFIDTVRLYMVTNVVLAVFSLLLWFVPVGEHWQSLWLGIIFVHCVILGFTLPLHFSIMAFADDYGYWKNGIRSSGMNFAFNLFFIKLAWASSAGIIALVFILVSYQAGADHQTSASLTGIRLFETLLPAALHLLLAITILQARQPSTQSYVRRAGQENLILRQRWFGCACCPPNIARLLASLGSYIYTRRDDGVDINLYIGSDVEIEVSGELLRLKQSGGYPWQDTVKIELETANPLEATLALRLPDWCASPQLLVNGEPQELCGHVQRGYVRLTRHWQNGDVLQLTLPMPVMRVKGNPLLRHVAGKVAIQRGPLVYCLEQADNGSELHNLQLPDDASFMLIAGAGLFKGKTLLQTHGSRVNSTQALQQPLYSFDPPASQMQPQTLTFVPYFSWANRGEGEMCVG